MKLILSQSLQPYLLRLPEGWRTNSNVRWSSGITKRNTAEWLVKGISTVSIIDSEDLITVCRRCLASLSWKSMIMMCFLVLLMQIGGIVRVCGLAMTPRIILMTDGEPTDSAGSVEVNH